MSSYNKILFLVLCTMVSTVGSFGQIVESSKDPSPLSFEVLFESDDSDSVSCYRIPAIAKATNGDLIATVDERVLSCKDLNGNKDINIVARRSADNGLTWSEIKTLVDFPVGQSASDPSMIVDAEEGTIFLFYNFMDHIHNPGVYHMHLIKSRDHGRSWSEPLDITAQITKPEWKDDFQFITSGKGIQTKDGLLVHTLVNLERGLFLFLSDDHGMHWRLLDQPISPGDESKIVELNDGRWMINSRVNGLGYRFVHYSEDHGKSWWSAPDSSLVDPGCNASIVQLTDMLVFSNIHHSNRRQNLTVRASINSTEWGDVQTVYAGAAAYSDICQTQDGQLGLMFEADDYRKVLYTRLSMKWLVADQ